MIFSIPILIAAGPCLLMAMAALALFVVHHRLSRARHALIWSCACAASTLQWAIMATRGLLGGQQLHGGPLADLTGLAAVLLLAEGFRVRAADTRCAAALPTIGVLTAILLLLPDGAVPSALRPAIVPLVSLGVLGWAATMVARPGARPAASEIAVVTVLLSLALVHLAAAGAAFGEWRGLITTHRPYVTVYMLTAEPGAAAIALAALLLIAFDFSVELRRLVHTDPLTGALNRLGLDHAAGLVFDRGRTRPFSLAIADIDHFKQVNDRYGHVAGDAALVAFAGRLIDAIGRDGSVARIGGEEFALLMPGTRAEAALHRVEALRAALPALRIDAQPDVSLSASFGIAERAAGESLDGLIARADEALYRSKRAGRDRSTLAAGGGTTPS